MKIEFALKTLEQLEKKATADYKVFYQCADDRWCHLPKNEYYKRMAAEDILRNQRDVIDALSMAMTALKTIIEGKL